MAAATETPAVWLLPFTVADEAVLAGLDEDVRAVVERYARHVVPPGRVEPVLRELEGLDDVVASAHSQLEDALSILHRMTKQLQQPRVGA